jgi:hypothetical protein
MATVSISQYFGRDVSVYEIHEQEYSYMRLFYMSTGTGNERFNNKFKDTLFPFYGERGDGTMIKGIMKKEDLMGSQVAFKWQNDLLKYLGGVKVLSDDLTDIEVILDTYINTLGELYVSIMNNEGRGFWHNKPYTPLILDFLSTMNIQFTDISKDYIFNPDSYDELTELKKDPYTEDVKKTWKDNVKYIEHLRQDERTEAILRKMEMRRSERGAEQRGSGNSKNRKRNNSFYNIISKKTTSRRGCRAGKKKKPTSKKSRSKKR